MQSVLDQEMQLEIYVNLVWKLTKLEMVCLMMEKQEELVLSPLSVSVSLAHKSPTSCPRTDTYRGMGVLTPHQLKFF